MDAVWLNRRRPEFRNRATHRVIVDIRHDQFRPGIVQMSRQGMARRTQPLNADTQSLQVSPSQRRLCHRLDPHETAKRGKGRRVETRFIL